MGSRNSIFFGIIEILTLQGNALETHLWIAKDPNQRSFAQCNKMTCNNLLMWLFSLLIIINNYYVDVRDLNSIEYSRKFLEVYIDQSLRFIYKVVIHFLPF